MFKWLKNLLRRPRLIERYSTLSDIIDAHNKLVAKTADVTNDMSPAYLCSRINMIQDAEERAVKAFWRNKKNKYDLWRGTAEQTAPVIPTADAKAPMTNEQQPIQLSATPPLTALNGEMHEPQAVIGATEPLQTLELPQEPERNNVIEIHINK